MRKTPLALVALVMLGLSSGGSAQAPLTVLRPARVFDGETVHEGWAVRVRNDRIDAVGPANTMGAPGAIVGPVLGADRSFLASERCAEDRKFCRIQPPNRRLMAERMSI